MFKNYLQVALRNILRNKSASLIKIISLSVGMICFAIISLFVYHELSYDSFHRDPHLLYRVVKDFVNDDGSRIPDATTPPAFAPVIQKDIPEVEYTTRLFPAWGRDYLMEYDDRRSFEPNVIRIDSSFFDVFTFDFVRGEKATAVAHGNFLILTESTAARFFGNEDPIGKAVKIDIGLNGTDLFVTGVIRDVPENSHFSFDCLISVRTFQYPELDQDWNFYNFYTYVRLKPEADGDAFKEKLQPVFVKYQEGNTNQCYAQPLRDIHLKSHLKWELSPNGDYSYIRILATIALFTILLAAINYINLVTAQSSRRAKEVGIRKVSGAAKKSLILQFLLESLIMATAATVISLAIVESILPSFSHLFNSTLSFFDPGNQTVLWIVIVVGIVTGLLAGLYPAFYLSAFQPVKVLKGAVTGLAGNSFLRKGLVTFQFVISTVLIIGTFVISGQLDFVRNTRLGFEKENIMIIQNARNVTNLNGLLTELREHPAVVSAGGANGIIGGQNWATSVKAKDRENSLMLNFLNADYEFLDVMGVNFLQGRNFSRGTQADSTAVILNETAVTQLGIPEDAALGSLINSGSDEAPYYYTVIGVIDDFHFTSFHDRIKPFGFFLVEPSINTLFVKLRGEQLKESVAAVEGLWKKHVPSRPFEFTFQDEQVAKLYAGEMRFQALFSNFTYVAIIIACLGLFGLSAYTVQQRTKEIGIRKVLGASVLGVTGLLSKEFLKLVLLAVAIAVPVAWYAMSEWLQNFAYHVELQIWTFLVSATLAVAIALLTVSFQSIKAGLANPVNALRNE